MSKEEKDMTETVFHPQNEDGTIMDWLYYKCRDIAGRTDKEFIEAARFGAKALNQRMCGDDPLNPQEYLKRESHVSIWRDTSKERPRDCSTIVLCNAATIHYAYYHNGYFYADAICDRLENFYGKWCYKADLWGISQLSHSHITHKQQSN